MFAQTDNNNPDQEQPAVPVPETGQSGRGIKSKPKKVKVPFAVKAEDYESAKGLQSLYERTNKLELDGFSEINVENTMKKIVVALKSWHFEFMPRYSYDHFLSRSQKLGNEKRLSGYMNKVRNIHKGNDVWTRPENTDNERPKPEGQEEEYLPNQMHEENKQAIEMMNNFSAGMEKADLDIDDEEMELMEMMERVAKKAKPKSEVKPEELEDEQPSEPYVPEGFEDYGNPFSQSQN